MYGFIEIRYLLTCSCILSLFAGRCCLTWAIQRNVDEDAITWMDNFDEES